MPQPAVPEIVPSGVAPEAVLLDVREPEEWQAGHAPGARHIPLGELVSRLGELPRESQLVVVCRSGGRSTQATAYLVSQGYDAVNLGGGMRAWAGAGRPMRSENGRPPTVV